MSMYQDPVMDIMDSAQRIILDSSFQKTKFIEENTSQVGSNALYNTYLITTRLPDIVKTNTFVLSMPMKITIYFPKRPNKKNSPYLNNAWFKNSLYADMGIMQALHQIEIKLGNNPIGKSESRFLKQMKETMVDRKFSNDVCETLGKWGLPKTCSYTADAQTGIVEDEYYLENGNLAWMSNDVTLRESFLSLLMSTDDIINGTYIPTQAIVDAKGTPHDMEVFTQTLNLSLPLCYINRAFNSESRLPANLQLSIYIESCLKEQPFGVIPFFGGFMTTKLSGLPKLSYAYDQILPELTDIVNNYRESNYMQYNTDLIEEININGITSPNLQIPIAVQQQLPTEIRMKIHSDIGYTDAPESLNWDQTPIPYFIGLNIAWFPDSLVNVACKNNDNTINNTDNKIRNIIIKNSGQSIYEMNISDDLKNGNFNQSAIDYILQQMNQVSFLNIGNKLAMNMAPTNNLNSKLINGGSFSFIYMPGGKVGEGTQPGDTSAKNIVMEIGFEKTLAAGISVTISKKIPSQLLIDPQNNVTELMWPQLQNDGVIKVLMPRLAN